MKMREESEPEEEPRPEPQEPQREPEDEPEEPVDDDPEEPDYFAELVLDDEQIARNRSVCGSKREDTMTDTDKPMPGYFPLHAAKDPMTGAVCFAPMLRFDMDDPNAPDAGHSLADAIVMAIDESADGVGDADGKVIYDRADCERLFELAQDLKNLRYRFPSEFLAKKRWVLWKPIWNEAKKKFGKPPFSPLTGRALSGEMGSAEREANYVDFDAVETAALKYRLKVGINLTAEDNCVVVDFDDAFKDGVIDSTVTTWLKHLPSYAQSTALRAPGFISLASEPSTRRSTPTRSAKPPWSSSTIPSSLAPA